MADAGGYILILSAERKEKFKETLGWHGHDKFAESVSDFTQSRSTALVCFVSAEPGKITHIAKGRRGMSAGTGLRRLNLEDILLLQTPVPFESIADRAPGRVRSPLSSRLITGGLLPPKSFDAFIEAIQELAPDAKGTLNRFSAARTDYVRKLSDRSRQALASQKEAVLTALNIAGIRREELQEWIPSPDAPPASFLDGLPKMRAQEDALIASDMQKLPGFENLGPVNAYPGAVFESEQARLTVILANKLPLEQQTGTDLIYYNETFKSFVMVQYKAMEKDDGEGSIFRLPDTQLAAEISRMAALLASLGSLPADKEHDAFRLNLNPFFLKLCPRMIFKPDDIGLTKGMYLHLDHWKAIEASGHQSFFGPKGGRRVSYGNVRRFLNNSEFVSLVANAWVGTTPSQSALLATLVRAVVENGKAVIVAVKTEREPTASKSMETDGVPVYEDDEEFF
jgi:hypothetical protein